MDPDHGERVPSTHRQLEIEWVQGDAWVIFSTLGEGADTSDDQNGPSRLSPTRDPPNRPGILASILDSGDSYASTQLGPSGEWEPESNPDLRTNEEHHAIVTLVG